MTVEVEENKKVKDVEKISYEELYQEATATIAELQKQMENIIKRYRKLSVLYNEAIEKILSSD